MVHRLELTFTQEPNHHGSFSKQQKSMLDILLMNFPKKFTLDVGETLTVLPKAKMVAVTAAMSFLSERSVVWKISSSGTPYFLHASWNLQ